MRFFMLFCFLFFSLPSWAISESSVEKLVKAAPEVKSSSDLERLAKALTQGLKTDEEKAYAVLTWIVQNVDYDNYKYDQIEKKAQSRHSRTQIPDSGDILKTRLGVCEDIAELYDNILEKAEIQAKVIEGCTEKINRRKKECQGAGHVWNAVWIDKQWELVDPTWAITGGKTTAMDNVSRKTKYDRELKKRQRNSAKTYEARENRRVDKKWFMVSPEVMQKDHYPFDEKWTLTKTHDRKNKNL